MQKNTDNNMLTLKFKLSDKPGTATRVDPEEYKVEKSILKRYLLAFKELAKR